MTTKEKIKAAIARKGELMIQINQYKKFIETLESEAIAEGLLIDRYREEERKEIEAEQNKNWMS